MNISENQEYGTSKSTSKHERKPTLLEWKDTLPWQRDNDFILTGYRRVSNSYSVSIKSILRLHNETVNIWSHLIGALLFALLLARFYSKISIGYTFTRSSDVAALSVFYLSVAVCFSLSTFFHTFSDHSRELHRRGNELDHIGIVLVMWGSGVPADYFGFYCQPRLRNAYWVVVTLTALGCGVFTLRPQFRQPSYRTARFMMYCFLGGSLIVPAVHGILRNGWAVQNERMSLTYFAGLAGLNFSGAALYAARIPERWCARTFDLCGQSHNLMHILVICGAMSHLTGLLKASSFWSNELADKGGNCF